MANFTSIGIDNGLFGAVVAINSDFQLVYWADTPIISLKKSGKTKSGKDRTKNEFAPSEMKRIIEWVINDNPGRIMVWLERAHAMPDQGVNSMFTTGKGAGLWEGIVVGMGIPYNVVSAAVWTKFVLKDIPRGDPKQRSFIKSQRLFPTLPLVKPKGRVLSMDGRSDASLIAYYGALQMLGVESRPKRPVPRKGD